MLSNRDKRSKPDLFNASAIGAYEKDGYNSYKQRSCRPAPFTLLDNYLVKQDMHILEQSELSEVK